MNRHRIVALGCCCVAIICAEQTPARAQEPCLTAAWQAFNSTDYVRAIAAAERCIDEFGRAADREEAKIAALPLPRTGSATAAERNAIFARGLLNDVGTAWFVKGRSAEFLFRKHGARSGEYKAMAIGAYQTTCRYKHALTWDPKGFFWSPCVAASDRLPLE